ncbi:MAG: hypothetical protein M1817_001344 [Caeruleum heppii]|nr:MAG: hypothetical protein M1817_001344 [Caeruleum heppii]
MTTTQSIQSGPVVLPPPLNPHGFEAALPVLPPLYHRPASGPPPFPTSSRRPHPALAVEHRPPDVLGEERKSAAPISQLLSSDQATKPYTFFSPPVAAVPVPFDDRGRPGVYGSASASPLARGHDPISPPHPGCGRPGSFEIPTRAVAAPPRAAPSPIKAETSLSAWQSPPERPAPYEIRVRQQPLAARACGFGERDRRVIDPPPIVQLLERGRDPMAGVSTNLRYPFNVVHCTLWNERGTTDETALASPDRKVTRRLMGTLVSSPFVGLDEYDQEGCFFCFPDLSCRTNGRYRLRFVLMRIEAMEAMPGGYTPIITEVMTDVFTVFTAKDFPGMRASTALTKALKRQGCAISVKKGNERANAQTKEEESAEEETGEAAASTRRTEVTGAPRRSEGSGGPRRADASGPARGEGVRGSSQVAEPSGGIRRAASFGGPRVVAEATGEHQAGPDFTEVRGTKRRRQG